MRLLNITLPPTLRVNWVSDAVREAWEPQWQAAARLVGYLEHETVRVGLREATTAHVSPEALPERQAAWHRAGLVFLPLRRVGNYTGFAHGHPPVVPGKAWHYYGVLARSRKAALAWDAAENGAVVDHAAIGELLGYPRCCIDAFDERWRVGQFDPIWAQSAAGTWLDETHIRVSGDRHLSALWRYAGLRAVPHLPCSWTCEESQRLAASWGALARRRGYGDAWASLEALLALPASWEAYKGLAVVRTPVARLLVNSLPCYPAYEVQYLGQGTPAVRTRGLRFPYESPQPVWLEDLRRAKGGDNAGFEREHAVL